MTEGVVLRRVVGGLWLVALIGVLSSLGLTQEWQAFVVHDSDAIDSLVTESPTFEARYGLYADLRELAAGSVITVPGDHPLDEDALRSISLLTVEVADYDADPQRAQPVVIAHRRVGRLEGEELARGTYTPYVVALDGNPSSALRLWFDRDHIVVATDPMGGGRR